MTSGPQLAPLAGARAMPTDRIFSRALPNVAGGTFNIDLAALQTAFGTDNPGFQLLLVRGRFVTNATAGNRFVNPNYQTNPGPLVLWQYGARSAQLASQSVGYSFVPGWAGLTDIVNVSTGVAVLPLPDPCVISDQGQEFLQISANGANAGDGWNSIVVQFVALGG